MDRNRPLYSGSVKRFTKDMRHSDVEEQSQFIGQVSQKGARQGEQDDILGPGLSAKRIFLL